ncbi:MAG: hypothetical protein IJZ59_00580 [Alphaproteobacteria bacterium]|nr:hypothetical protein [Alphaproteobacteria bacterium]
MNYPKNVYIIICEGPSEKAYLQELNRYLEDNDYPVTIVPKTINNGHFKPAQIKFNEVKKQNPKDIIYIWVDKDTYIRNDEGDGEKYNKKPKNIPDFHFNYHNFEDFLAMHMPDDILSNWQEICRKKNHFNKPLHANIYEPLYKQNIINDYEKGSMPFPITKEQIINALKNQKDTSVLFKSDFLNLLDDLIKK